MITFIDYFKYPNLGHVHSIMSYTHKFRVCVYVCGNDFLPQKALNNHTASQLRSIYLFACCPVTICNACLAYDSPGFYLLSNVFKIEYQLKVLHEQQAVLGEF